MRKQIRWTLGAAIVIGCGRAGSPRSETSPGGTSAVSTIVPSESETRVTRVEELLRGVAGLEVSRLPDGNYRLRIRGQRSIRGNPTDDDPLLVIDGVPIAPGALSHALADLSPRDVARIDVLKDAGATSAYGSRGANGVILITTRRAP